MISASCWVPRGFASEFPEKYELDEEEMARIEEMANLQIAGAKSDLNEAEEQANINTTNLKTEIEQDDDLKEYDLENYDNDPVDENGEPITMFPGLSNTAATYHKKSSKSKSIVSNGNGEEEDEDFEDYDEDDEGDHYISLPTEKDVAEEKAEMQVYPTDNMILATRTEDDVSYLDVYIYDDGAGAPMGAEEEDGDKLDNDVARGFVRENNLYIHHDLMLPSFPLCVEWMSFKPNGLNDESNVGNFAAVGTFDPTIEIWNLDSIDKAFPDAILGENEFENNKKKSKKNKKKGKSNTHVTTHHTDAVLSLSHNKTFRNVLASTSADSTVKLWDLTNCKVARSMNSIHQGKHVSSSQWFQDASGIDNGSILLTGGYDSYCCVSDVRISEESSMSQKYKVGHSSGEEIEAVKWASNGSSIFYAGTDQGNVYCFDAKVQNKPLWTLHAHDSGISTLESNSFVNDVLVTGAMGEKAIKLWKVDGGDKGKGPSMVLSRDFGCGNVLSTSFAPDIEVAGNLVIGGANSGLKMWDCFSNRSVRSSFKTQLRDLQIRAREDAKKLGRASRIARKYNENYSETVMEAEMGADDDEDEDEDEELE